MSWSPDLIVAVATEAASGAQLVTVAFETGDAISEGLDSCTTSRKYVINSPRSYKCRKIRQNSTITCRSASVLLILVDHSRFHTISCSSNNNNYECTMDAGSMVAPSGE